MGERAKWSSRLTFILAAVGSAVGLGNAWRFPGLAAKHGGGTFLFVYLLAMLVMGIPLLMMEIAIARNFRKGAIESMRGIKKGLEPVGWAATSNAFVIVCYYAVVFAWVILMFVFSWKFAGMTGTSGKASALFEELTETTWAIEGYKVPLVVFACLLAAWGLIYYCIRNGANSVGKVVKYTVFAPVILLVIMAVKGCTMPGAGEGIAMLFIPKMGALKDPTLWVDAIGQVFYSLSIMMAIMFAYGSYLGDDANIAVDAVIIAFSDMAVSVLSAIVMFSTMGGTGMLGDITASGIGTAFLVYPEAIVNLTNIGWFNAVFGAIFYLMLITLAIDSAFSIVEGVSAAIADKFHFKPKKVTISVCVIAGIVSILFVTRAGVAWLDIVDNWANNFNLIIIGVLECIAVGWCFSIVPRGVYSVKYGDTTALIRKRKVGVSILLSIITLGIYQIYWKYLLVKNMRAIKKDESSCTGEMVCFVFLPFYSLYWWITRGKTLKDEFEKNGVSTAGNEIIYMILGLCGLDVVSMAVMQNDFNSLPSEEIQPVPQTSGLAKVLGEINMNTKRFRMPYSWLTASIRYIAPVLLTALFSWNVYSLFHDNGGSYSGYPIWAQIAGGWAVTVLVFASGFIAKLIVSNLKKKGFKEDTVVWNERT